LGKEFFKEYGRVAADLSKRYLVEAKHVDLILNDAHEAWKTSIHRDFTTNYKTYESRWQQILETLAVSLCTCNAITFEVLNPVSVELTRFQQLLVDNPAIFSGLKFVRDQYLKVILQERDKLLNDNVLKFSPGEFAYVENASLRDVILKIKLYPKDAGDFIALLRLPRRTVRFA
jgi:hypothetical protein